MSHRLRRGYDHRIKEQIVRSGDPELFPDLEIPRSTAVSWIRRGVGELVSLVQADGGEPALRERIAKLEGRVAMLTAVLRLVLALLRVSGFSLERSRVPDAAAKRRLLGAVERARRAMPLSAALRVLRLSSARYHIWVRAGEVCRLDDRPSCPRSMPQRLTYTEVEVMAAWCSRPSTATCPSGASRSRTAHRQGVRAPRDVGQADPRARLGTPQASSVSAPAQGRTPHHGTQRDLAH
jgi:putative transposase